MTRRPSWISRKPSGTRPSSMPAAPAPAKLPPAEPVPPPPAPPPPPVVQPIVAEPDPAMVAELERLRDENDALKSRVAEMAVTMGRLRRDILQASEPELVGLALSIAERVVRNELATDPSLIVAWAREALHSLAAKGEVLIALAPDVAAQVPAQAWEDLGVEHKVQADSDLPEGTVEVRTPEAVVAAGAQARLQAVGEALGVTEP